MRAEKTTKSTTLSSCSAETSDLEASEFVAVAIPATWKQSEWLKADLEMYEIPAMLETEMTSKESAPLDGVPVLVPESRLEQASQIIDAIELNALDDEDLDDLEDDEDEFEDLDELEEDEEDEFDEELDEEEEEEDFESDEKEEPEEDEEDDFFYDDAD